MTNDKKSQSKGITPAYLAWKRAGSPGSVWCLLCDQPADADHVHTAIYECDDVIAQLQREEEDDAGFRKDKS
jgi:hypothetical protein